MERVTPLPAHGTVFFDERDDGRSMRLSYHADSAVFVLSLWRFDVCLGTFRLAADDAPELVQQLVESLAEQSTKNVAPGHSATA